MSANGRDQVKSNTAFTISARVRSDFPIFSIACGWARNGDVETIFDIVSFIDGDTSEFKVRFQAARQSLQSQTADTRHSSLDVDGQVCLRFFDVGQCVRYWLGGLARVDKSDKVEAAGCGCRAMGKAQAPVPDIG